MSKYILGLDIGSVTVKAVLMDTNQNIIDTFYDFHNNDLKKMLSKVLHKWHYNYLAMTQSSPPRLVYEQLNENVEHVMTYDNKVCQVEAGKHFFLYSRSILTVGGENMSACFFDAVGNYDSYINNVSCVSATGNFLDQQAIRLGVKTSELVDQAMSNHKKIPRMASHCSGSVETDLIHAEQDGYSLAQISDGLCQALAKNISDALVHNGVTVYGPIAFIGGVAQNAAVLKHLRSLLGVAILVHQLSHVADAVGASMLLAQDLEHLSIIAKKRYKIA